MDDEEADRIPVIGFYRGCAIEDQQPAERIERVVKPAIDHVHNLGPDDTEALNAYARDARNPPEARMLAAARLEAMWQLAEEGKRNRPPIDRELVQAHVAGLGSQRWRNPWAYSSLLDCWQGDVAVPREQPLDEEPRPRRARRILPRG